VESVPILGVVGLEVRFGHGGDNLRLKRSILKKNYSGKEFI